MAKENLPEYTVNDFSAVDDQISQIAKRERARLALCGGLQVRTS